MLRAAFLFVVVAAAAPDARAQISPECAGTERPRGYDEDHQQAFLQNYFATTFLLTQLGPILPYAPGRAGLGLEVGLIPPLGCEHRLVLDGTKTEDTNKSPVNPRPRLVMSLPDVGPVSSYAGFTIVPPVPSPIGTMLQAGGEAGAGWRSPWGLVVGARAHLTFARMRAEIASPFDPKDAAVEDLFFASVMGVDAGAGWRFDPIDFIAVTPYASVGAGDVSTLFLVGDDGAIVQNLREPWTGATASVGVQGLFFDHLEAVFEASTAFPVLTTVKAKIGVVW